MDQKTAAPPSEQKLHSGYQPSERLATVPQGRPGPVGPEPGARATRETVMENSAWIRPLHQEIGRIIVGQTHLLDTLLIALLTNGHVLLEGVPGLAKTLALKTLASCI